MVVNSRAEKAGVANGIFLCARLKIVDDFRFREWSRKVERVFKAIGFRNRREKLFNGSYANIGQHFLALGGALRQIAHQAEVSFCFSSMKCSYAAASMRAFTSAGLAS